MTDTYLDLEPRRPIRTVAVLVVLFYLAVVGVAHLIYWAGTNEQTMDQTRPNLEIDPVLVEPNVLHASVVGVGDLVVAVPYQAGFYEIAEVLPAELTAVYREKDGFHEARVVTFVHPLSRRWKILAPFPTSMIIDDQIRPEDLLTTLQLRTEPGFFAHLFPWRLVGWTARSGFAELITAEGRPGRLVRLWQTRYDNDKTVVGREYEAVERMGRIVALTVFQHGRSADVRFSFNSADPNNMALVRAYSEAIDLSGATQPDNEAELLACERLQDSGPDPAAIRICREIFLVGQWLTSGDQLSIGSRLVELYRQYDVEQGLVVLHDRLALLRGEDAKVRRLIQEIEASHPYLFDESLSRPDKSEEAAEKSEQEAAADEAKP